MSALDSRRLKHPIVIQEQDKVSNGIGGRRAKPGTSGWRDVATPWAEVIALRGDQAVRESINRAVQVWRVTIRYRDGVRPSNRIIWGAVVMDIKSAAPNEAGDGLVMTCESGTLGS